jgi:HSP20 family protein
MQPIRKLRSELERGVARAWEGLSEGWREVLTRGNGALTQFVRAAKWKKGKDSQEFPQWAILASECWETAGAVIVRIELPGMRKEDIDISLIRGRLQVRGEKRYCAEHETRHYHLMERAFGRFERSISLPPNVDPKRAEVFLSGWGGHGNFAQDRGDSTDAIVHQMSGARAAMPYHHYG